MMRRDKNVEKVGDLVKKKSFVTIIQQSKYGLGCLTVEVPRLHTIRHTHTHTALLCTSDQPVAQAATYTTQHNTTQHKRQTSMPSTGFVLMNPEIKQPQTYTLDCVAIKQPQTYTLDCMATWISHSSSF